MLASGSRPERFPARHAVLACREGGHVAVIRQADKLYELDSDFVSAEP